MLQPDGQRWCPGGELSVEKTTSLRVLSPTGNFFTQLFCPEEYIYQLWKQQISESILTKQESFIIFCAQS